MVGTCVWAAAEPAHPPPLDAFVLRRVGLDEADISGNLGRKDAVALGVGGVGGWVGWGGVRRLGAVPRLRGCEGGYVRRKDTWVGLWGEKIGGGC